MKNAGKLISFDPNLREPLWESEEQSREAIWYGIGVCDVLKIADNEIKWLTGKEDYDEGVQVIKERSTVRLINVTLGNKGSSAYYTIDATGAGDTFCACVVSFILEHGLDDLADEDLERMLLFANAAASIVTTRRVQSVPCQGEKKLIF